MTRRIALLSIALVAVGAELGAQVAGTAAKGCATVPANAPWVKAQREQLAELSTKWTNDSMRAELKGALGSAWTEQPEIQFGWAIADSGASMHDSAFSAMVGKMRRAGRGSVSPSRTTVGVAGTRAMYVLAWSDTALLRSALRRMMEAGPDEGIKPDIALMEDRVRLMSGRKQLYGTQLHWVGATLTPFPIEDSSHVDLRRDAAALPPLVWAVCNAKAKLGAK